MKNRIISFVVPLLLMMTPRSGQSTHAPLELRDYFKTNIQPGASELPKNMATKGPETKVHHLNWKEKIILKIVQKKLAKKAKSSANKKEVDSGAIKGFIVGVLSVLSVILALSGLLIFLAFGFAGGIVAFFVCLNALKRIKRQSRGGKGWAILGLILGLLVTGFFLFALIAYLDWAN